MPSGTQSLLMTLYLGITPGGQGKHLNFNIFSVVEGFLFKRFLLTFCYMAALFYEFWGTKCFRFIYISKYLKL